MPEKQHPAPWKDRFQLKYARVFAEVPALIRLQTLKPSTVASLRTVLIVNCCLIGDFIVSLPAITDFVREHSSTQIDLLISPSVAPLRGFELVVVRDEDAVRTEIHFVLIEYLQLVVIWDHDDDGPD